MRELWPAGGREWIDLIIPAAQVLLIVVAAWLLQRLARLLINRLGQRSLPRELQNGARRISAILIYGTALLLVLQRLGVSAGVLWAAFTGFAAVAAVAFFAVWSVLSNIFCTVLIFTFRPFRLNEHIELIEHGDQTGLKGKVVDINLIYTTLEEEGARDGRSGGMLQIPNSLFFQRALRRVRGNVNRQPSSIATPDRQ